MVLIHKFTFSRERTQLIEVNIPLFSFSGESFIKSHSKQRSSGWRPWYTVRYVDWELLEALEKNESLLIISVIKMVYLFRKYRHIIYTGRCRAIKLVLLAWLQLYYVYWAEHSQLSPTFFLLETCLFFWRKSKSAHLTLLLPTFNFS